MMQRQNVESTMVSTIGYDNETSTLEITFSKSGQIWEYYDVPENVYQEMITGSIGQYFLKNIKNQYRENRIG